MPILIYFGILLIGIGVNALESQASLLDPFHPNLNHSSPGNTDCAKPTFNFLNQLNKNLKSVFQVTRRSSSPHHAEESSRDLSTQTQELVQILDSTLKGSHDPIAHALNHYDGHHFGRSYLNYLTQNRSTLEHDPSFLSQTHSYIQNGTHFSIDKKAISCPNIKIGEQLTDSEKFENVLTFTRCFVNQFDADIVIGDWGHSNVDRGQLNSFIDLVTTPYTPYSYVAHLKNRFPNPEEPKTKIIQATFSIFSDLTRLSGSLALLKNKTQLPEFSPDDLEDLTILLPHTVQDLTQCKHQLEELKHLEVKQSEFSSSLNELEERFEVLTKTLEYAYSEICSNPLVQAEISSCQKKQGK